MQCVSHCDSASPKLFDQPVLQTLQMFIGELFCWLPVFYARFTHTTNPPQLISSTITTKRDIKTFKDSFVLALPALCDVLATTLMNLGLLYVPVSIYQMTRGSVILIVGLLSVSFLKQRISRLEWCSLLTVSVGVGLVGLSGYLNDQHAVDDPSLNVVFGMFLIFAGISLTASQFVIEEHVMRNYDVGSLRLVGFEGIYGGAITILGMVAMHLTGKFNVVLGISQMFTNTPILITSFGIMVSIATFNFFGVTLTSELNATARSTIDTCRTLLVWVVSLAIGWESFHSLQLFAFSLLVLGTFAFNGVIQPENWAFVPAWLKDLERHEQF